MICAPKIQTALFCSLILSTLGYFSTLAFSMQQEDPWLRFGINLEATEQGVVITEVTPDRVIGSKLSVGDILIGYTQYGTNEPMVKIVVPADLDAIKALLSDGIHVVLHVRGPSNAVLKSNETHIDRLVELDINDVLPNRQVVVQTVSSKTIRTMAPKSSTAVPIPSPTAVPTTKDKKTVVPVEVFYGTDRKLSQSTHYTGARETSDEPIKYGICEVSIPPDHRNGELDKPFWQTFARSPNPLHDITLTNIRELPYEIFVAHLSSALEDLPSPRKRKAFIFVHGYNVTFDDAARRTAQLQYDLQFPGICAFFSWPSNGTSTGYIADEADIEWSTPHVQQFIKSFTDMPDLDEVIVLAHSMGNRGVARALLGLKDEPNAKKIKQIILAAADVDAGVFERDIAPILSQHYKSTTVYSTANDRALASSEYVSDVPRVGITVDNQPSVATMPNITLIDATKVNVSLVGHAYYGDSTSVIGDLRALINNGQILPRSNLKRVNRPSGEFWRFE